MNDDTLTSVRSKIAKAEAKVARLKEQETRINNDRRRLSEPAEPAAHSGVSVITFSKTFGRPSYLRVYSATRAGIAAKWKLENKLMTWGELLSFVASNGDGDARWSTLRVYRQATCLETRAQLGYEN